MVGDGAELVEERGHPGEEASGSQGYYSSEENDCDDDETGGRVEEERQGGARVGVDRRPGIVERGVLIAGVRSECLRVNIRAGSKLKWVMLRDVWVVVPMVRLWLSLRHVCLKPTISEAQLRGRESCVVVWLQGGCDCRGRGIWGCQMPIFQERRNEASI